MATTAQPRRAAGEPPRRVLVTADAVGGVWTYVVELARALAPFGVEVTLATMGPRPSEAQRAEVAAIPGLRLVEGDFPLEWIPGDPWPGVDAAGGWLRRLADEHRVELVHLNGYAHAALAWPCPRLVVAHSCVRSWWRAVEHAAAPAGYAEYTRRVDAGLAAADLVVAPTRAMLAALEAEYRPLPRARVVPNGRARPPRATPAVAKERFVLSAGRLWDEAKNLGTLDRAARLVEWPVRVAGDARAPDGNQVTARHAELLGKLDPDAMWRWFDRAAIFALPARYEPFGLSVLEAGLAGCALVLGDIPSLRETWRDAAAFVPPDDDDALADLLGWLAADPRRWQELGARAAARAAALGPERMASGYVDLYRALWAAPRARVEG